MGIMIKTQNLCKSFGSLEVLKDIALEVAEGETVSVIGPSGSGKSTLIRCLNLLERPDKGQISIDGLLVKPPDVPKALTQAVREKIGMVFQSFNLFPHYDALHNVAVGLISVKKIQKAKALEKAASYLEKVGLSDKAKAYPAHLSGGQQQRVAIARSLAMEPRIILMDEPTSALDPELVQEVLSVIRGIATAHTMTTIIVTHELNFASEISDRVYFMDKGLIVEEGSPKEIFLSPAKERTKAFLAKFMSQGEYQI
jgi:ABC-type polar amino acid transport system ATPase subunit